MAGRSTLGAQAIVVLLKMVWMGGVFTAYEPVGTEPENTGEVLHTADVVAKEAAKR